MEKHQFKVIESAEDDIYRIIDLTDTSIVGVTEMYETDDEFDREWRIEKNKELKRGKGLGVKVLGYGIFICLDEDNMQDVSDIDRGYLMSVLRQMAVFFKEEVINKNLDGFKYYALPKPQRKPITQQNAESSLIVKKKTTDAAPISESVFTAEDVEQEKKRINRKQKKEDRLGKIILYIGVGIAACVLLAVVGFVVWLLFHAGGLIGLIIFILCGVAFIPELFREKR